MYNVLDDGDAVGAWVSIGSQKKRPKKGQKE